MFFTNRQYQRDRSTHGQYRGAFYTPWGVSYIPCISSFHPSYWSKTFQYTKKYFICEKVICWSTNHIQQGCDDLKKKFGNYYPEYNVRSGYERNLQCWITKDEDVYNDECIAHYFGDLSINTHDNYTLEPTTKSLYIKSEQFHTLIGQLQDIEFITVINTLADTAFKYQIILNDETVSPISPASYIFNLLTNSRYNNIEFQRLLIDSGASTRSTRGISQLKILQQLDTSVQLDKNPARSANFIFGIRSTILIGSVNLDTPLGFIIFYIVPVNTLFLLCLADMNKHRVFINNITNQVIQP